VPAERLDASESAKSSARVDVGIVSRGLDRATLTKSALAIG
jgi:hypothetical protein